LGLECIFLILFIFAEVIYMLLLIIGGKGI
jgi:hypothetical protein